MAGQAIQLPRRIVVLGGGTAGWMTACLLAHRWGVQGTTITVVESPDIGIIGVGEGSTPQLKAFFDTLGIAEADWMPACNATYKTGIAFHGWSMRSGFDRYFHPFPTQLDQHTAPHFYFHTRARRTGRDVWAHPDRFFLPAQLAAQRRAPVAPSHFPFEIGYGYHFDATLVGTFLRTHATTKLAVVHLERTVCGVKFGPTGNVAALACENDESIEGDFFIDASGFRSTILQEAMGEPFLPFAGNLFNDRAVAMPTPNEAGLPACETRATALSSGWVWRIPLTSRTGNGYVYSSSHLSADEAEVELRAHLGVDDRHPAARHLKMKVGRVARSWAKNCLAVGLAQGFIEPLEATALHIVQATVEGFIEFFEAYRSTDRASASFNSTIAARYEGIRDYIVAHYRFNTRSGEYWRANAANQNLSDSLKGLMTAWFRGADLGAEIAAQDIARFYPTLSWHCLMAGYGSFPDDTRLNDPEPELQIADMKGIDRFVAGCAQNFPTHETALAALVNSSNN